MPAQAQRPRADHTPPPALVLGPPHGPRTGGLQQGDFEGPHGLGWWTPRATAPSGWCDQASVIVADTGVVSKWLGRDASRTQIGEVIHAAYPVSSGYSCASNAFFSRRGHVGELVLVALVERSGRATQQLVDGPSRKPPSTRSRSVVWSSRVWGALGLARRAINHFRVRMAVLDDTIPGPCP